MKSRLTGLIAAPFTALNSDRSLNLPMIKRQAKWLVDNGVAGAFICGTTGEGMSLSVEERQQIAEQWMSVAPTGFRVIVHVGHPSIRDSRRLAAHAEEIGAFAFATMAPTFFRIANVEQLVNFCAEVAEAAPRLPFFYYHFPGIAGADLPMHDFLALARRRIPNLAGLKFTHENLMDYRRCVAFENGRYDILFGRDEILLSALAMGAAGAVGTTFNLMPAVYLRLIEAFRALDLEAARKFQSLSIEVIAVMGRYGGIVAGKAMMKMIGLDCGPVRPPLPDFSAAALAALKRELKAAGFPARTANPPRAEQRTR